MASKQVQTKLLRTKTCKGSARFDAPKKKPEEPDETVCKTFYLLKATDDEFKNPDRITLTVSAVVS